MTSPKNKLNDAQKAFVVQRLAAFEGPKQVADAMRAQFGIEMAMTSVSYYDPTTYAGRNLSVEWRDLFLATRERILAAAKREVDGGVPCPRCQAISRASPGEAKHATGSNASSDGNAGEQSDEARLSAIFALLQKVQARTAGTPDALDPVRLFDAAMAAAERATPAQPNGDGA